MSANPASTMSVIAEITLDQEAFGLGAAMASATGMQVELDRVLPVSDRGLPYLWVSGEDFEAFEAAVASSELVRSCERVDVAEDTALYRIEWEPDTESLMQKLARSNVAITEGVRRGDRWFFRLRFDDHDELAELHRYCREHGIDFELNRVYADRERRSSRTVFDLTPEQADTVMLAIERGYYRVPREVTLEELGAELRISSQATSERLRRATDKVLRTVLYGPIDDPIAAGEPG